MKTVDAHSSKSLPFVVNRMVKMAEQPTIQALLNVDEPPRPPDTVEDLLPEHPLELHGTLTTENSLSIHEGNSKMVSEKFASLENSLENGAQLPEPPASPEDDREQISQQEQQQRSFKVDAPPLPPVQKEPPTAPATPGRGVVTQVQGSRAVRRADAEAEAAAHREHDVAAAFAALPQPKPRWTSNYFKILLVGDDGLGKTTFVRNLFAAFAKDPDFPVADASGEGAVAVFRRHPERLCTELVLQDEDDMVWWHYQVQDTPGYGDFDGPEDAETQRSAILSHIRSCSRSYLRQELDSNRTCALHISPDTRIDICLYFLSPNRMRRADKAFLRDLAQAGVPTVPIIAKADTLTPEELEKYRNHIRETLDRTGITWNFSREALEDADARKGPPFCVISASTLDRNVGRFWPVRKYPWGRCEALSTAHSDLAVLRKLLLETAYWELKAVTEARYLKYRKAEHASEANPVPRALRPLLRLAVASALAGTVAVLAANTWPLVKDRVVRREVVRRVKGKVSDKVGTVVDSAVGAYQEAQDRVEDVAQTTRQKASAALESGKHKAATAASRLEHPEVRKLREEAESAAARARRPWWRFWG